MQQLQLNGTWQLHDEPLAAGENDVARITGLVDGWIEQPVPGDIHQGLVLAGRIREPLEGLNSFDCRWTEDRSWWYRRQFDTDSNWLHSDAVELELNGLDSNASIYLNGTHLGDHSSAFYPFRIDIRQHLNHDGPNTLLVRLTSGVEHVTQEQLDELGVTVATEAANNRPERGDARRVYVRKPQYSFGWDWSPRVATTAIAGDVLIRTWNVARIWDVAVQPYREQRRVGMHVTITVDSWHYYSTARGTVQLAVSDESGKVAGLEQTVLLRSGLNYISFDVPLAAPRYWWPNGLGEQHRYSLRTNLIATSSRAPDGPVEKASYPEILYGLRFVELDLGDVAAGLNRFSLVLNGKRIFCKGADWIPADALYARVTPEKYDTLVHEAQRANFNMLRVWGGGLYEPEAFYDACDRYGILLWHDFMFACAPYPDHIAWFREEVRKEAEYQTVRLRNHACMGLWSGSNENNWGFDEWWHDRTQGGAYFYNELLPSIVQSNCPGIPYWNGSPYGGASPNSAEVGDRHHWQDCMMNPEMAKRIAPEEYDLCNSLFVTEYGYIGAPDEATVIQYLNGAPSDRQSRVWQHHTNTFEKDTVEAGIRKHYADPDRMTLNQYYLYSGLTQGLMYSYSLDSLRSHPNCHGSLFWMFADCWGEVGWTVMDYYLRRKIAWYFVRRALSPVRLILREVSGRVSVIMANDTPEVAQGTLEYGSLSLDGSSTRLRQRSFSCPALSRRVIATFSRGDQDPMDTLWMARIQGKPEVWPAILRVLDIRQLKMKQPNLAVRVARGSKGIWRVRVSSDVFAHAVHLNLPASALPGDNYFDLLPRESREVSVAYRETLSAGNVKAMSVVC